MFSATLADPKVLKDSIDTIAALIDEGTLRIKPEGLELIAADRAMVAMVDWKLSSSAFENWNCDKPHSVGLNLLNLLTVLKRAGPDDKITLKLNETENRFEITLTGDSLRKFAVPLLELGGEEAPNVSAFEFAANAEVSADVLAAGIDDAAVIADSVTVELEPSSLKMWAEGDSSKTELKLDKGSIALTSVNAPGPAKSRYPLDYLKKALKAGKLASRASLKLSNDYPMRLDFIGDKVKLGFIIAPRVAEE